MNLDKKEIARVIGAILPYAENEVAALTELAYDSNSEEEQQEAEEASEALESARRLIAQLEK